MTFVVAMLTTTGITLPATWEKACATSLRSFGVLSLEFSPTGTGGADLSAGAGFSALGDKAVKIEEAGVSGGKSKYVASNNPALKLPTARNPVMIHRDRGIVMEVSAAR